MMIVIHYPDRVFTSPSPLVLKPQMLSHVSMELGLILLVHSEKHSVIHHVSDIQKLIFKKTILVTFFREFNVQTLHFCATQAMFYKVSPDLNIRSHVSVCSFPQSSLENVLVPNLDLKC